LCYDLETSRFTFLIRDDAQGFGQETIEVAIAVGVKDLVGAHPLPFPDAAFTGEFFFDRERRFKQEEQNRTIDHDTIATKAELTLTDGSDDTQAIETSLFFHFTNRRLSQILSGFASTLRKRPALIRIFNEENLNVSTALAIDNAARRKCGVVVAVTALWTLGPLTPFRSRSR